MEKFFPTLSVILNVGSVVFYLVKKDIPHAVYWCLAAGLTTTVTWFFNK